MEVDDKSPGLGHLLGRIGRTTLGIVRNRAELLAVEWQEEKERLSRLLILSVGMTFLGVLAVGLITAFIIALIPADYRVWALGGFALVYLAACVWAWFGIRALLNKEPFAESIEQVRKDTGVEL
jgi:uncharacterized membrane protein YqjE